MRFRPTEVLFSPTADCNLDCPHCTTEKSKQKLPAKNAGDFLSGCRKAGVKRVGFTGGEPFLNPEFLYAVTRRAVKEGMLFDRIMTNGVWYKNKAELKRVLKKLRDSGYDGDICVSIDAFHRQSLKKLALFVETAVSIWNRPDMVSIASVGKAAERATRKKLKDLTSLLANSKNSSLRGREAPEAISKKGLLRPFGPRNDDFKRIDSRIVLKKITIDLSPIGKAGRFRKAWSKKWFKDDYCKGPGNALFVLPDGDVKPCCGYAADSDGLTIGNIRRDSAKTIIENAGKNNFIAAVFGAGLGKIRKRMEVFGFKFPGRTDNHCFFCYYLQNEAPEAFLKKCLRSLRLVVLAVAILTMLAQHSCAFGADVILKKSADFKVMSTTVIKKTPILRWYHEGMYYDGKKMYVANGEGGKVWVLDPETGKVLFELEGPGKFTESIIGYLDGKYLLTDWDDEKLYIVNISGEKISLEKEVFSFSPAHPAGAVLAGERLLVITWTRGFGTKFHVVEFDKDLNYVGRVTIKGIMDPAHMAWDGKNLWITSWFSKTVFSVDIDAWEITGSFSSPADKATGIAWDGRYLWITGTYDDLYCLEVS